ncbi:MAG: glycosyltransferase family 4 protein [Actinobacteria bacterium]|nr:glycosyltransferase family 4 protein [Actinomycetota bacterium]
MTILDSEPHITEPLPLTTDALDRPGQGLRVLYVLKRYPRLSETFVVRELLGLEAAGVSVGVDALLTPEPGAHHADVDRVAASVRYLPRKAEWSRPMVTAHLRVGVHRPLTWVRLARAARRTGGWRRFAQAGMVADRVRGDGFHHVHAHFATAAAEVARDAAALSGVTFSVTAHAKDIFHEDNTEQLPRRVAGAATVVTVSEYNVRHLADVMPMQRVRFVPNGLPMPGAAVPSPDGPVLCVARLVPKKGIDVLIRAMAVLQTPRSLEIVGDGACRADLERLAGELGVDDRVRFLGALTSADVDEAYRRCALVALPCRIDADGDRDGMPTVLVEAMARAVPVVSTDVVGIDELVHHGHSGLLVRPEDPTALAAAIDQLLGDPEGAAAMGRHGREHVIDAFAPARATSALLSVFREAVSA